MPEYSVDRECGVERQPPYSAVLRRSCLLLLLVLATLLGACVRKVTMAPINAPPRDAAAYQARRNAVALPIITYHRVTADTTSQMAISPALFNRHMSYLKENGYTPITLDEWYIAAAYGLDLPEKPVAITFDDAWVDQYHNAVPILAKYGFHATFYAYTAIVGNHIAMSWDQLRKLAEMGHCVGSHTMSHGNMARHKKGETDVQYDARIVREIAAADALFERHLGAPAQHFCYPYGYYNTNVIAHLKRAQYRTATTVNPSINSVQTPMLLLGRMIAAPWVTSGKLGAFLAQRPLDAAIVSPGDGGMLTRETTRIEAVMPSTIPFLPSSLRMKWNWEWTDSAWYPATRTVLHSFAQPLKPGSYSAQLHAWDAQSNHYVYAWQFQQGDILENDVAEKPPELMFDAEQEQESDLVLLKTNGG